MAIRMKKRWLGMFALGMVVGAWALVQSQSGVAGRVAEQLVAQAGGGAAVATAPATQTWGTWPDDARVRFSNWQNVQTDLSFSTADVVAVGNELYALGEYGAIYRSQDAGLSWSLVGAVRQDRRDDPLALNQLAVLPAETDKPAVYFAVDASSSATLYRVSEGRSSIIQLGNPARPWESSPWAVVVSGSSVLVAHADGVSRSDDRGQSWQQVLDTNLRCSDVVAAGRYVYASCNGIYRSIDGGPFQLMANSNLDYTQLAVAPSDPQVVYAANDLAVYRSRDAGATWTRTLYMPESEGLVHATLSVQLEGYCETGYSAVNSRLTIKVDPANPDVLWWGREQLFRSDDGGENFGRASVRVASEPLAHALPAGINGLAFANAGSGAPGRLLIATNGGIQTTDNRGAAVQPNATTTCQNLDQYPGLEYTAHLQGMNDVLFREVAIAGDGGVLATTPRHPGFLLSFLDEPDVWSTMPFSTGASAPHYFGANPYGSLDRFYTSWCLLGSTCRWDLDTGAGTWMPVKPTFSQYESMSTMAFDPNAPGRVWSGGMWLSRSEDGLETFLPVGSGGGCSVDQIAVSPANSNIVVMATGCGVGRRTDALSLTGEADWSVRRLTQSYWNANALMFDPRKPNNVYLTVDTSPSVYASADAGATWAAIDVDGAADGLPNTNARTLALDPESTDILYLGTSDGLFVSWNAGTASRSWHEVPLPFPGMSIEKVAVRKTGLGTRRIYVYTHGVGLWTADVQVAAFNDVLLGGWSSDYVERLLAAGVTSGCSATPPGFCPEQPVLRDQMAVFVLRALHGSAYAPPAPTGVFGDVPQDSWAVSWIEQLAREGITSGCSTSPAMYCPGQQVSRGQMAVFLLRAKYGPAYQPPAASGRFVDVPVDTPMSGWIEQLAQEGITGGCSATPAMYCPDDAVTREQMAVFLVKAFGL